jgi:hypothetical protein
MNSQAIQPMGFFMPGRDFIVIDTEGKSSLSEIAIIDSQGKLIYEAFTQGHPNNAATRLIARVCATSCKSLPRSLRAKLLFAITLNTIAMCCETAFSTQALGGSPFLSSAVAN